MQNSDICFDVSFVQRWLNIVVEMFLCSTTKEMTLTVCSAKSSIQIPNIYTLWYAIINNYYVVIDIGQCIIAVRLITVYRDADLGTFIFLVVDNLSHCLLTLIQHDFVEYSPG